MYIQRYKINVITQGPQDVAQGEGFEILDDDMRVIYTAGSLGEMKMKSDLPNDRLERLVRVMASRQNVIGVTVKQGKPVPYRRKRLE